MRWAQRKLREASVKASLHSLSFSSVTSLHQVATSMCASQDNLWDIQAKINQQDDVARKAVSQSLLALAPDEHLLPESHSSESLQKTSVEFPDFYLAKAVSLHSLRFLPSGPRPTLEQRDQLICSVLASGQSPSDGEAAQAKPRSMSLMHLGPFHYPGRVTNRWSTQGSTLGLKDIYDFYGNEFLDRDDPFFPWNWYSELPVSCPNCSIPYIKFTILADMIALSMRWHGSIIFHKPVSLILYFSH